MENNSIVPTNQNQEMSLIQGNNRTYCSVKAETNEEKKKLYNALESCDILINDIVGQKIKVKDVYIQEFPRTNKDTGEPMTNGHRVILFDEAGKTYVTASNYFFISLIKVLNAFGDPQTWDAPLEIEITKRPTKGGNNCLSLKLV